MEEKKIVGFHKFFSQKKQQWYMVADCICKLNGRDISSGYVGSEKVEQIFIPDNCQKLFEELGANICGKTCIFKYEINGRFVNLVDVVLK